MGVIMDIGSRVELVSMDPHFHEISIGLYRQDGVNGPEFLVHTYSGKGGSEERIAAVVEAMRILGGVEVSPRDPARIRHACGGEHEFAIRRLFLEACKLDPAAAPLPYSRSVLDRKSGLTIEASAQEYGQYRVQAQEEAADSANRVEVVVNGLKKLGEMLAVEGSDGVFADCVAFGCGHDHHELVGLLLQRAPNVRALVREQDAASARGTLVAPSQQR
ncbi:MAG: hypothetical protein VX733_09845 [Candidatus Latescibacterota bacterium]|nr:hypothetical protein [Candidatus Latescibacterota bacterium]